MSKASDYAKRLAELRVPQEFRADRLEAIVDSSGGLRIFVSSADVDVLSAEDALRFGNWILDTFGDKP